MWSKRANVCSDTIFSLNFLFRCVTKNITSVLVEILTGHNPTEDISFVKAVEELSEIATTYPSQRKIQEELDNSAFDNLLGKQSSIREKRAYNLFLYRSLVPGYPQPPVQLWEYTCLPMKSVLLSNIDWV